MKQTKLAIVFNGEKLTKTDIETLESGFAKVISDHLASNKKYRNYSIVRDFDKYVNGIPPKFLTNGIIVEFSKSVLSQMNFDHVTQK